ncbi:A/G-specific adenine glycosylase [Neurospora intermedia]|uniref:Adenine DNA glycosylase n=1 Tax=Neurospora intermedia TaxID=5142 RepID=A0ABR3D6W5_NEUIN
MADTRRRSARIADAKVDPLDHYTAPEHGDADSDSSALSDIDESEFDSDVRPAKRRKSADGKASRAVRKTTSTTVKTVTTKRMTTRTKASATTTTTSSSTLTTTTLAATTTDKPKATAASIQALITEIFDCPLSKDTSNEPPCYPSHPHPLTYHNPLLLSSPTARINRNALFAWFDSVSSDRQMPWRKPWIDTTSLLSPSSSAHPQKLKEAVAQRAYEVLLSETMLQQTRVSTVIAYYNKWLAALPTMQSLAAAQPEEVLSLWKGLGYYSRATRLHALAQLVCPPPEEGGYDGLLPQTVDKLVQLPGIGRYTAGAVASIVYGRAEPMVDGNVIRVLTRQLGIRGDVKSKEVLEVVWEAAKRLVEAVAWDGTDVTEDGRERKEPPVSDRPGRWGQGLMELGATVCLPGPAKPKCGLCPVKETCRAYQEGVEIATRKGLMPERNLTVGKRVVDIKDCCTLCPPPEAEESDKQESDVGTKKKKKQGEVSAFFDKFKASSTRRKKEAEEDSDQAEPSSAAMEVITSHCSKYPYTKPKKKKLREEECLVVAIRRPSDGRYLIHKRPAKGLLAGMWELPSHTLPVDSPWNDGSATMKKDKVRMVLKEVLKEVGVRSWREKEAELGTVPWTFSHFKLAMHVWAVDLIEGDEVGNERGKSNAKMKRWATMEEIEGENMGTGMKKCWELVKESRGRDPAGGSEWS